MIPALKTLLRAFFLDETAFLRMSRALIMAIAAGGMGFAQDVADALGAPGAVRVVKTVSICCMGLALMLGAGDKTPPEVKALVPPRAQ